MNYISAAPPMGAFDVFTYVKELEKAKAAEAKAAEAKAAEAKAAAIATARARARVDIAAKAKAWKEKVAADARAGRFDLPADPFDANLYKLAWIATGTPLPQGVSPPELPSGGPSGAVDLPAPPSSTPLVVAGAVAVAVVAFLLMRKKS